MSGIDDDNFIMGSGLETMDGNLVRLQNLIPTLKCAYLKTSRSRCGEHCPQSMDVRMGGFSKFKDSKK
ncbi:unnamed protein product [Cercopithifilaria johnstoni]|uniref:Uncharacterized protein n=1 Tax=Cercopithifilaria johnstoni TaxID=2874296 RepID=A0A8J2QAN2_9BILA|nr:unnamed protein product [Cercopithifilaria johnstoni]